MSRGLVGMMRGRLPAAGRVWSRRTASRGRHRGRGSLAHTFSLVGMVGVLTAAMVVVNLLTFSDWSWKAFAVYAFVLTLANDLRDSRLWGRVRRLAGRKIDDQADEGGGSGSEVGQVGGAEG